MVKLNDFHIIKVLIIGGIYPPTSGVSLAGKSLYDELSKDCNYDVTLLNTSFNKQTSTIEEFSIIKILKLIYYILKLLFILITKNINYLIIMHSLNWKAFYKDSLFMRLCHLFNVKIILYAHGIGFDSLFYNNLNINKKCYVDNILLKINKIVVVSEIMKNEYSKWIDFDNIFKIYNICDPLDKIDRTSKIKSNNINILYLSFLSKNKGIFDILDAFNNISKDYSNIKLILCGSFLDSMPEERKEINNYINENNLINKIDYRGHVTEDEKTKAFYDADIFVLPSYRESFGIANIEAMSAGLPIVSTFQGAIPEYIENGINGFLHESGNKIELEKLLRILLEDEELRINMGLANRRKYYNMFSIETFSEKWKAVLLKNS